MLEPFCQLLEANPELSLEARTPSAWAKLLKESIPEGSISSTRITWAVITRCFWSHRSVLESRLNIIKNATKKNPGHLYQLSLRPTKSLTDADVEEGTSGHPKESEAA